MGFRSVIIRAVTMTYELTGHPCKDKWIVGAPGEMGPAKGTAGGHLPEVPQKLASPQSIHTQSKINV